YLLTFISIYLTTLLSLRIYLKKIRPAFFYLVFSIPLIYFLLKLLPFFNTVIASLIAYSPTFYGALYSLTFSGTGPLGGILFSMVLLAFSRRVDNVSVRNYLSISALGMLLFFIANQNPPFQESLLPPFGLISKSFIGLSCYMILVGIYLTVTHLSRRNTLTNVVLKELSRDRLFRRTRDSTKIRRRKTGAPHNRITRPMWLCRILSYIMKPSYGMIRCRRYLYSNMNCVTL
ncbi:MAG: hypothetical protein WAL66_02570, partial [Nitrososphaeraceae archaeon]